MNHSAGAAPLPARGFTLIEVMVTVAIIGILAAIAIPMYSNYVLRGNRSAAQSYLIDLALAETQYLVDMRAYTATKSDLKVSEPARVTAYYTVSIAVTDATSSAPAKYKITAAATGRQVPDGDLTIDESGNKWPGDKW